MAKGARGGRNRVGQPAPQPAPQPLRGPAKPASGGGGTSGGASTNAQATQQAAPQAAQQAAQPAQQAQQVPQVTPAQSMSASYNAFVKMSDDQKADVITQTIKQGVPAHLQDNDFQKFIYNMDMNDRPDVVDHKTFQSLPGPTIWRTVDGVKDTTHGITYTAPQICRQVMGGRVTRVSAGNKAWYGSGIYFAGSRNSSIGYGTYTGQIQRTAVMQGKLNQNAKVMLYDSAVRAAQKEMASGSKLGRALRRVSSDSVASIYAVSKGYNVLKSAGNYYNILNRNAITMSDKIEAK